MLERFGEELIDELAREAGDVLDSPLWERVRAARQIMAEAAFEAPMGGGDGIPELVRGRVDLAFLEPDGWVLVDYKSDDRRADGFDERLREYRNQLEVYSKAWERASGVRVKERVLYFTLDGESASW